MCQFHFTIMTADSPTYSLNQLLLDRCREPISVSFVHPAKNTACVQIGCMMFKGAQGWSERDARDNAALVAFEELSFLDESAIRRLCGLPVRSSIREIDEMRDVLRLLRGKVEERIPGRDAVIARTQIAHGYTAIYRLERQLLQLGMKPDE